jgi:hypothetical protein
VVTFIYLFAYISRTLYRLHQTWHAYSLRPGREHGRVKTLEEVPWVRFPVRTFLVARKLSTIEERRQRQSCLSRRGDYTNEGHNPENLAWVLFPVKMISVTRKLSTTKERRQDQSYLSPRGEGHNPEKLSWVRFPVKMFSVPWIVMTVEQHR